MKGRWPGSPSPPRPLGKADGTAQEGSVQFSLLHRPATQCCIMVGKNSLPIQEGHSQGPAVRNYFPNSRPMYKSSNFQPFSSHSTHKLISTILQHTKKYIFFLSDKNYRYNFDSFTPNGYCSVGSCHLF